MSGTGNGVGGDDAGQIIRIGQGQNLQEQVAVLRAKVRSRRVARLRQSICHGRDIVVLRHLAGEAEATLEVTVHHLLLRLDVGQEEVHEAVILLVPTAGQRTYHQLTLERDRGERSSFRRLSAGPCGCLARMAEDEQTDQ